MHKHDFNEYDNYSNEYFCKCGMDLRTFLSKEKKRLQTELTAAQQRIKELENALTAANMALEKADGEHWKHLHRIKGLLAILKRLIDGGTTNEKELQAALGGDD